MPTGIQLLGMGGGQDKAPRPSLHPPGSYTPQVAVRSVTPQEWHPSRLKSSPPPPEARRTSYTPGPTDESFPEEEEGDWEPPMRSVVGTLVGLVGVGRVARGSNTRTGELGRQKRNPEEGSGPSLAGKDVLWKDSS